MAIMGWIERPTQQANNPLAPDCTLFVHAGYSRLARVKPIRGDESLRSTIDADGVDAGLIGQDDTQSPTNAESVRASFFSMSKQVFGEPVSQIRHSPGNTLVVPAYCFKSTR